MPIPLLLLGDAPTASTGLGRILRELAIRIYAKMPDVFRVATFGVGGSNSRSLPFTQYTASVITNYVLPELPKVWQDFAGDEDGIVLTIWNAGWLEWLSSPEKLPSSQLKNFLQEKPFKTWAYVPIDGDCGDGRMPQEFGNILTGFDRVLAYTKYGADVIDRTAFPDEVVATPHLPHGLDTSVFYPRDRAEARRTFVERIMQRPMPIGESVFFIGVVATNTSRKDWYLAFETCAELLKRGVNVGLWAHTDSFKKNWDLQILMERFGMVGRVMFSNRHLSDEDMAWGYSACGCTLAIASGGGWEFPIAESLACGVPVVSGAYAGSAEYAPKELQVEPVIFRGDGLYGIQRPVYRATDWADRVMAASGGDAVLPSYIDWNNAFPEWEKWLKSGVYEQDEDVIT